MKFTLTISNSHESGIHDGVHETARILREVADRLEKDNHEHGRIREVSGNYVGYFGFGSRLPDWIKK